MIQISKEMVMRKFFLSTSMVALLASSCCLFTPSAFAKTQIAKADASKTYPKAYFDPFTPQTAREMIDRLPGFTLDIGEDLRGFGNSAGNVLINGARPSSKSGGLEEALQRISAASVDRIEVIRGAAGTSEAAGQAVVANVITMQSGRTARWEFQLERAAHNKINASAELALSQTIAGWETSTKINSYIERQPLDGTRISRDVMDDVTFSELESRPNDVKQIAISSEAKRPAAGGTLVINGRLSHTPFSFMTERRGFDGGLDQGIPDQLRNIEFERTTSDAEFGVDWTRPLPNDWRVKMLSLSSFRDVDTQQNNSLELPVGIDFSNSLFVSQQKTFETVLRSTFSRGGEQALQPEFGAELAYNRLDSALTLSVEDAAGVTNIALPAADVLVEELRGEAFANFIWKAAPKLTVETGLGAEYSEISVSGDAENTQSFFFAKPFTTLIYDPKPGLQFRLGARRTVGQLDFSDFAASASASDDRLIGGNPDLGPDQTTSLSTSVDLRSETRGAFNVEVFHEWRDDVLEQIVLPSGAQGLGNAGSARVWGLKSTASLPLSNIISGGLLEIEAEFLNSTISDSVISQDRSVSSIDSSNIFVQFRQDIPQRRIAWGVSYRAPLEGPFFFADEISLNRDGRQWTAFVETTRFFGVKANLELAAIGEQNFFRERRFFSPDRGGTFQGSEIISRDRGMFATLTISGQF
jgi:hypothetical protein